MILLHYTRAEQKCNLRRVRQRGQLHRLPGNRGDGGYDSSVKQLWWGWGWLILLHALLNIIKILILMKNILFVISDDSKNQIFKTSNGGLRLCGSITWECVFDMIQYDICLQCRGVDRFFTQWHVWQHRSDSRRSSRVGFAPGSDCCSSLHQLSVLVCFRVVPVSGEHRTVYIYQISANCVFILTPSIFFHRPCHLATQEPLAILEVSEATAWLLRSGGRPRKRTYCWNWDSLKIRMGI